MKILRNYLLAEFSKFLAISLGSFSFFYIIVDFITNIGAFTKHSPQFYYILLYFLLKLPEIVYRVLPLSVLLSAMLLMISFNKNNEIMAIRSSGLTMLRFTSSLIIVATGISVFAFMLSNFVTAKTNIERRIVMQKYINKKRTFDINSLYKYNTKNISIHYRNFIIIAKTVNLHRKLLKNINIYQFNNKFKLVKRYNAKSGLFLKNGLELQNGLIIYFHLKNNAAFSEKIFRKKMLPIKLNLNFFKSGMLRPEFLSIFNIGKMLKVAKKSGSDLGFLETSYYSKFAFPVINLILIIIGISIGLSVGKKSGASAAIGISILFAFGYWIINSVAISLGTALQLNPVLAAFMADITFSLLGIYLIADID